MQQWTIKHDKVYSLGEVDYLGVPYEAILRGEVGTLPDDYDGWFPFLKMCYSIGDMGIISGLWEALKTKYPKIKIAVSSVEHINHVFYPGWMDKWNYNSVQTGQKNYISMLLNNPYIDKFFQPGEFDLVFTDHDRSYTGLQSHGQVIRSVEEPLVEQILRRFGFTDEDFKVIDVSPKLYFSQEEVDKCESILNRYVGSDNYGCLLFASRLERFKNRRWEGEEHLYPFAEQYKNLPVFVYSQLSLENTQWNTLFPNRIDFSELDLTIREQIYIKRRALFNIGYQSGITDASSGGGSDVITLCPYDTIRENCIRGTRYVYTDGRSTVIEKWK